MGPGEFNGQAIRQQLERVLSSSAFARSDRLSAFLRFVIERHLEGRDSELKESLIAVEVFGRKPDYDPKLDSIVRTEAGRLRARLAEYYTGEGSGAPVIFELPKGGYTPVFRQPGATRHERETPSLRFRLMVALGGLAVALAAIGWWWVQHRSAPVAIAVLPLENLSHDPANDYFADGLTDEIIRNLSVIEGLAVRSRTSSFVLKGQPRNVREAGKQLQVDYILEGSVLRAGQQLRVNAQLVRVRDDFLLWSGRLNRELTDVFAIQEEISRGIVNNLRLKLGHGRRRYETSVEAYDLYLRARALRLQRGWQGTLQSIEPYEQAIAKDPSFAPAYAGLATAYSFRSTFFPLDHPHDELSKMRAAAEKAIQLDPLLAEAHDALGVAYARDGQWEQAEKSFRHAIEIDPNSSITYNDYALWLLMPLGRIEGALHQLRAAEKVDPLSFQVHSGLSFVLISAGQYDEAAEHCPKMSADNSMRNQLLGRARVGQGRIDEAIQVLAEDTNPAFLGYAYARSGRREEAEKLAAANAGRPNVQAVIYAGLGDKDRAFEALDRMAAGGAARVGQYLTYPELAVLRGDPRLKNFRKKIGLPQ